MKWKDVPWKKSCDTPRQHIKKQRHLFADKGPSSQSYGFSSSHVWMWELDCKEGWAPKNKYFWTVVLEKTLESPLNSMEIKPVNPKGDQLWIFIGRTDAEAEALILWPWKNPDAGKDWGQKKGETEDEMVGWHLTQWTWVWVDSRSWWWTGRPGVLWFMGSQRVRHDWVTELILPVTDMVYINISQWYSRQKLTESCMTKCSLSRFKEHVFNHA